jgi:membrane protease YdiL (CAAX protease family)
VEAASPWMGGVLDWAPAGERRVGAVQRLVEVTLCVAAWIGIGEAVDAGINTYLLIGIPIVALFQLLVRRRPIKELWVRGGPGIVKWALFRSLWVLIALFPVYSLIVYLVEAPAGWFAGVLYALASLAGAGAAAYAFTHFDRRTLRYLLLCLATAGVIGIVPDVLGTVHSLSQPVAKRPDVDFWVFVLSVLTYIPALYVMEEVAFRGAFDSHAHHEGDRLGILTAIYVSCLWGVWHAPIFGWDVVWGLIAYQGAVGTFLSIYWRKSGNLGVSATTHAIIDSIRNAMRNIP